MASALKSKLDVIVEKGGIKQREVAQLLSTTPQTISRWQSGRAAPQPRTLHRLLTLGWLVELLAEFYSPDEARLWLFSPNRHLKGERPADLIAAGREDDVLKLIDQMQSSAYI